MLFLYPYNLLLVSLAAGISLYLGFLPVRSTPRKFFVELSFLTILLWALAAFLSGLKVGGYILGCGIVATMAWRQFRIDRSFGAKLWLSGAAAFGGTLILLMLAAAPREPDGVAVWFHTSVYFGALLLTVTFMAAALAVGALRKIELPPVLLDNALLFVLLATALRLLLLVAIWFGFPLLFGDWGRQAQEFLAQKQLNHFVNWIGLAMIAPFGIACWARLQLKKGAAPARLWSPLAVGFLAALAGEFLARQTFYF